MKLGIINIGCKRKKNLLNIFKRKIVEKKYKFKKLSIVENNVYLNKKKANKYIENIKKNLFTQVDLIYNDSINIKEFFLAICIILYKEIIEKENLKPYKQKILIYDEELVALNIIILEQLCFIISECHIISGKKEAASYLCDYMKNFYGATYKICDLPDLFKYDAVIDLDNLIFRLGRNIYINDLDFNFSDIEKLLNLKQINLASFLHHNGYRVELKKLEGRKAFFEFDL